MLALFLLQMTAALERAPTLVVWQRPKNKETMEALEYTVSDVRQCLLSLAVEHSLGAPEKDDRAGHLGTVAVFGPWVGEPPRQVYVKVLLVPDAQISVECMSFHFPANELRLQ